MNPPVSSQPYNTHAQHADVHMKLIPVTRLIPLDPYNLCSLLENADSILVPSYLVINKISTSNDPRSDPPQIYTVYDTAAVTVLVIDLELFLCTSSNLPPIVLPSCSDPLGVMSPSCMKSCITSSVSLSPGIFFLFMVVPNVSMLWLAPRSLLALVWPDRPWLEPKVVVPNAYETSCRRMGRLPAIMPTQHSTLFVVVCKQALLTTLGGYSYSLDIFGS